MKSLSQFITENNNSGSQFNKEVNISKKQFESLRKDLNDDYSVFYNEDDNLYVIIYEKSNDKSVIGDHVATYVYKTGEFFYDSEGPLANIIEKYIT